MKKLCAFLLLALLLVPVWAGADDLVLPDPAFYFNRGFEGNIIEFDAYPKAEYDAYVSLLQDAYGMSIVKEESSKSYELVYLEVPGIADTRTLVGCFTNSKGSGIEFDFGKNVALSALDEYTPQTKSVIGEIAWDDGRMIADPGDFLGYEIKVLEIAAGNNAGGGFMKYTYEAIPIDDILALADAINASPYFKRNSGGSGSINDKYFWLICHDYTGPDKELAALCESGRAERYGRSSDLSIYIFDPDQSKSTFAIYEYPGFTINSTMAPKHEDHDQPGDICSVCDGDGKCNECGGTSWVWVTEFVFNDDGFPVLETNNKFCGAIYCNGGSCDKCGGDGVR